MPTLSCLLLICGGIPHDISGRIAGNHLHLRKTRYSNMRAMYSEFEAHLGRSAVCSSHSTSDSGLKFCQYDNMFYAIFSKPVLRRER